ncbi:unnamed protein product [Sphagnum balticum]
MALSEHDFTVIVPVHAAVVPNVGAPILLDGVLIPIDAAPVPIDGAPILLDGVLIPIDAAPVPSDVAPTPRDDSAILRDGAPIPHVGVHAHDCVDGPRALPLPRADVLSLAVPVLYLHGAVLNLPHLHAVGSPLLPHEFHARIFDPPGGFPAAHAKLLHVNVKPVNFHL